MKETIKASLDAAFAKEDQRVAEQTKAAEVQRDNAAAADEKFSELVSSVIRPAMESMGEYLRSKNRGYFIYEDAAQPGTGRSGPVSASVTMLLSRSSTNPVRGSSPGHEQPHLKVILNRDKAAVFFHQNTIGAGHGGMAGGVGDCLLSELSEDLIQEKIANTVKKMFGFY